MAFPPPPSNAYYTLYKKQTNEEKNAEGDRKRVETHDILNKTKKKKKNTGKRKKKRVSFPSPLHNILVQLFFYRSGSGFKH